MRKPFIAGNWKMFKTKAEAMEFAEQFKSLYHDTDVRTAICAPYIFLESLRAAFAGTDIKVGAQNAYFEEEGAFTGEISVKMLEEIGVDYCIVGHSERRQFFGETDQMVNQKLRRLFEGSIVPILCIGETLEQRDGQQQFLVIRDQLTGALEGISPEQASKLVIAYEPIWAIGTGRTASPEQAEEMCEFIRNAVEMLFGDTIADEITIQYGGSVKPANAAGIMNMSNIDGALVGGASLSPKDFAEIIDF